MSSEYLLMGGESGGKTTFTGGLIYYLEKLSDLERGRDYDITYPYNESVVQENIRDHMWGGREKKYPDKTDLDEQYIVRVHLYEGTLLPTEYTIEIMDIPGEQQESARNAPTRSLFDGLLSFAPGVTSEQDQLIETYRNDLKSKIENNIPLDEAKNEWEDLFKYRYLRSDSVIIMLNLYKLEHDTETADPKALDDDWLEIATGKQRTLILVSGCDVVSYDPDTFDGEQSAILGNRVYDEDLINAMRTSLTDDAHRKVSSLLNKVEAVDSDLSMFGVSIAAEDPATSTDIRTDSSGNLDVRGYEQVVQWLKQ